MTDQTLDPFGARSALTTSDGPVTFYDLHTLASKHQVDLTRLPFSIRVLLENALRKCDGFLVSEEDVLALARWNAAAPAEREIPFMPARVVLQDFTGVPAVVDLAALREAMQRLGGDPARINPLVPADLVIDHSVQVDAFGTAFALMYNAQLEFERNRERYTFLRWGQQAFDSFRVVPPATGIVHQVNLEYLASVVLTQQDGQPVAFFDTLVGTDSHTTMINGLGVLGWGVGGIEAEAVLLGQPYFFQTPRVVGVKLSGKLREGVTATDLVLRLTELLRKKGVVGAFVEYFGVGLSGLSLADRATIANMAPEYGATCGFFPIDDETLRYLKATGRPASLVALVEQYAKAQGMFRTDATPDPVYSDILELDLATVEPSLAGPRRPQDRVPLSQMKPAFAEALTKTFARDVQTPGGASPVVESVQPQRQDLYKAHEVTVDCGDGSRVRLSHGSVVIAAITSCTNTSNPSVMVAAGILARKAVERGLKTQPHVKTSLAPGSRVVTDYYKAAGLMPYLEALGFHVVGYGCTTCIGNSGTIAEPLARAIEDNKLVAAAVLSGNRNFEGRILPQARANFLASPPLVVAYALAGTVDIDLYNEPLGTDPVGQPVYLKDIWPSQDEVQQTIDAVLGPELYDSQYSQVFLGNEQWQAIPVPEGDLYAWEADSTYIQNPPFFATMGVEPDALNDIKGARVLALLGDSVTTDHISPAGSIPVKSPAGQYLIAKGVEPKDFNSYGARRGNHEVMMRGTFANIRLRNKVAPGTEGGVTTYLPTGEQQSIYDASMRYQQAGTPLLVIAGKEYGTGSSRDWAAKGTALLGVKAVIAESYERIHRSNLVGMGVLPLQFINGESAESLGLTGREIYDIEGLSELTPGQQLQVRARREDGSELSFHVLVRLDTAIDVLYYQQGGILPTVLRKLLPAASPA